MEEVRFATVNWLPKSNKRTNVDGESRVALHERVIPSRGVSSGAIHHHPMPATRRLVVQDTLYSYRQPAGPP